MSQFAKFPIPPAVSPCRDGIGIVPENGGGASRPRSRARILFRGVDNAGRRIYAEVEIPHPVSGGGKGGRETNKKREGKIYSANLVKVRGYRLSDRDDGALRFRLKISRTLAVFTSRPVLLARGRAPRTRAYQRRRLPAASYL